MQEKKTPPIVLFDIKMEYFAHREMHTHDFHEFFLTLNGYGEQYTSRGTLKMKRGDIFFFPAGEKHIGNGAPGGDCVGGVINLHERNFLGGSDIYPESEEILKSLVRNSRKGGFKITLAATGREKVFSIFQVMLEETRIKKTGYRCVVNSLMHQFLIEILRNSQLCIPADIQDLPVSEDKINFIILFLENHFTEQVDINRAARMANMSRSYFHAKFREVTGKTFIRYLNDLRIKHAEELLKSGSLNTETVAFRSGFTSISHFYKVFREAAGKTPARSREESVNP